MVIRADRDGQSGSGSGRIFRIFSDSGELFDSRVGGPIMTVSRSPRVSPLRLPSRPIRGSENPGHRGRPAGLMGEGHFADKESFVPDGTDSQRF
ncbi:MAG: hypothetical protein RLZZ21_2452 [Planctomycetota bacterium]|jgi:hypothetical protein